MCRKATAGTATISDYYLIRLLLRRAGPGRARISRTITYSLDKVKEVWISLIEKQPSSLPEVLCKDHSDGNDNEEACQASMKGFKWMTLEFELLRRLLDEVWRILWKES